MQRLHIGGTEVKPGWKVLNVQAGPGVDFVGNIQNLTQFPDQSWDEIYGSHVLEHVPHGRLVATLQGLHRVLRGGGKLMLSVPDLDILCRLFLEPRLTKADRFHVMYMMFGGQVDPHDYHLVGLSYELLREFLGKAGFAHTQRVDSFGVFKDTSDFAPFGVPISLNVIAQKDVPSTGVP